MATEAKTPAGTGTCDVCGAVAHFYKEKRGGALYERCSDVIESKNQRVARGKKAQAILLQRITGAAVPEAPKPPPVADDRYIPKGDKPAAEKDQEQTPDDPPPTGLGWRAGVYTLLAVVLGILGFKGFKAWK